MSKQKSKEAKAVKMEVDEGQRKRQEKTEKTKKTKKEEETRNGVLGKRQRGKGAAKAPEKKRAKRS